MSTGEASDQLRPNLTSAEFVAAVVRRIYLFAAIAHRCGFRTSVRSACRGQGRSAGQGGARTRKAPAERSMLTAGPSVFDFMNAIDEKGLPCNLDAERFILGSILMDDSEFVQAASEISAEDFSLEKHRRIFQRMGELSARGERIDRVTVANELLRYNELDSCDGLSYLVSLDDGLPKIFNLDCYIRIVKDKAILRRIIFTSQHLMNECLVGEEDPVAILTAAELRLREMGDRIYRHEDMLSPAEIIEAAGGIETFFQPPPPGVPTPWPTLNKRTFGLQPGDLIILGGRPSTGKTTAALQIAQYAVAHGVGTAIFSLEMSAKVVLQKLVSMVAQILFNDFRSGNITPDERKRMVDAVETLDAKLRINQRPIATVASIHAEARRLKKQNGIGLVVVDYLQLMDAPAHQHRYVEVGMISRQLKLAAHDLGIPFLVLSQLSRASELEKRRPSMKDLRESGNIEQDADVVLLLWAPDSQNGAGHPAGYTELIVEKQRTGEAGREIPPIEMIFEKRRGQLVELTDEHNRLT
jgi:replicative DNA helicase